MADISSVWPPDSPPTWTRVVLAGVGGVWLAAYSSRMSAAAWAIVGFVAAAAVTGLVAGSDLGARLRAAFERVGYVGRLLGVVVVGAGLFVLDLRVGLPPGPAFSLVGGVVTFLCVQTLAHVVAAREISRTSGV